MGESNDKDGNPGGDSKRLATSHVDGASERWAGALDEETAFWFVYLRDRGGQWPDDYDERTDPNSELQPDIQAYVGSAPGGALKILDVGSGPLTVLGKRWAGRTVEITAVDPLAERYLEMMERFDIRPPVPPQPAEAERLVGTFGENAFDLVYARNCLDHGYDPLLAIQQMLKVAKPGCVVLFEHSVDEAVHQGYSGLHQWNFGVDDGRFVIWRPGLVVDAHSILEEQAEVQVRSTVAGSGESWLRVALRKRSP